MLLGFGFFMSGFGFSTDGFVSVFMLKPLNETGGNRGNKAQNRATAKYAEYAKYFNAKAQRRRDAKEKGENTEHPTSNAEHRRGRDYNVNSTLMPCSRRSSA
jgi:hypothetical protein